MALASARRVRTAGTALAGALAAAMIRRAATSSGAWETVNRHEAQASGVHIRSEEHEAGRSHNRVHRQNAGQQARVVLVADLTRR